MTTAELQTLLSNYNDNQVLAESGVTIAGVRYMYLSSTDKVIRAKRGQNGIHTIKTTQGTDFMLFLLQYQEPCMNTDMRYVSNRFFFSPDWKPHRSI